MKLLLITDSLGLPRDVPEVVKYEETWCQLLNQKHEIHQCSIGGGTITQLESQLHYLKMYNPDMVIVQSGIVDCAPRAMSVNMKIILNSNRLFRKLSQILLPKFKNYLRKKGNTYTSEKQFEVSLNNFKNIFPNKIIWVGIAPSNPNYEKKVIGITKKIVIYNELIRSSFNELNFIEMDDFTSDYLMSDFIHLNKKGHKKLDGILEKRLHKLCNLNG